MANTSTPVGTHGPAGSGGAIDAAHEHVDEQVAAPRKPVLERMLDVVERVGNKVPHPVVIFALLIGLVILLSHLFYLLGASVTYEAINPETHAVEEVTTDARSLLRVDGIRFMFAEVVPNFMSFTAVGVTIVAMLGVGVAEEAGLIRALIHKLMVVAPRKAITYILVFIGIISSIAADAGYRVLIPLAAALAAGGLYGIGAGTIRSSVDVVNAMEKAVRVSRV